VKRPAFQFYPADWRKDAALQSCSLTARGLWLEMLCVMHECEPYGHLVVNGKAMTPAQLGRLVGLSERECSRLMTELEDAGVYSRDAAGIIFSRRMVKDERLRNVRAAGGSAGAEHGIKGAEHGAKGGRPRNSTGDIQPPLIHADKGLLEPPLEPPPSSSSAFASEKHLKPALEFGEGDARQGSNGTSIPDKSGGVKGRKPSANWSSPDWVSATAQTLGMPRIQGESDELFADRVHTAANARRRA